MKGNHFRDQNFTNATFVGGLENFEKNRKIWYMSFKYYACETKQLSFQFYCISVSALNDLFVCC